MPLPTVDPGASLTPYQSWVSSAAPVLQDAVVFVGISMVVGLAVIVLMLSFLAATQLRS